MNDLRSHALSAVLAASLVACSGGSRDSGAVWLDNPWDAGKASFEFDPNRFADPDALIREVHDKGVRFMVWLSPFVTADYETYARDRTWVVTGTRPDNLDATQLGALSPVMQTAIPPWWVSDRAIDSYRVYAELHHRLVPYIAEAARAAVFDGIPIVRPMPYAYPGDPVAVAIEDQYLFGPDLLVAPVTAVDAVLPASLRSVYLPAGTWTDFWSGVRYTGPLVIPVAFTYEQLPPFVREGANLPSAAASLLPVPIDQQSRRAP